MSTISDFTHAIKQAERLCQERGVRMTAGRRDVLKVICGSKKPLGAYEIMDALRAEQPKIAPPTVYRALDFLIAEGLIHKLETLHAYVGCTHSEHPHFSQFLICDDCGHVDELHSKIISGNLNDAARAQGFQPAHSTIEVAGRCADCQP